MTDGCQRERVCRESRNPYPQGVPIPIVQPVSPSRALRIALAAMLAMSCQAGALAQPKAAETDLRTLRALFRQGLLTAILPEKRAYAARLQELEKQLAGARDYAAAMKVREERLALEQEVTAFELELPGLAARAAGLAALLPERIVFRLQDAALTGLKLEKDNAISGWESARGAATWKLPGLPPGGYEVMVKYTCAGGSSAVLEVRESFYVLRGKLTAPEDKPVEKNLGTLRIRDGGGPLTLAADGAGLPAQLRIVALELAPVNR